MNNQAQALASEKLDVWVATYENMESNQKTQEHYAQCPDTLLTYYLQFHTHAKIISTPDEHSTATPIRKNIFAKTLFTFPYRKATKKQKLVHYEKMNKPLPPTREHISSYHHLQHIQVADYSPFSTCLLRPATSQTCARCWGYKD